MVTPITPPFPQSRQSRALLLILLLGAAVLIAIAPFAIGLLGGGVLYVICLRPYGWLRMRLGDGPAAIITLIAALVILIVPLALLALSVVDQAPTTIKALSDAISRSHLSRYSIGVYDVGAELTKATDDLIGGISGQAAGLLGGLARAGLNLAIAFVVLFYLLTSGDQVWRVVREYAPLSPSASDQLRDRFFSVTKATLIGTALVCVLQGAIVGAGFAIVGFTSPVFWGVVTAVASILPVLGSALVWGPGVLVLALQGKVGLAILLAVIGGGVASNIDNVIRPWVYERVSGVHPLVTLLGAFAGVRYFGLLGVLMGPLAIAFLFELIGLYQSEYGAMDVRADKADAVDEVAEAYTMDADPARE